jgi:hypothetical protein
MLYVDFQQWKFEPAMQLYQMKQAFYFSKLMQHGKN